MIYGTVTCGNQRCYSAADVHIRLYWVLDGKVHQINRQCCMHHLGPYVISVHNGPGMVIDLAWTALNPELDVLDACLTVLPAQAQRQEEGR